MLVDNFHNSKKLLVVLRNGEMLKQIVSVETDVISLRVLK